MSSSFYHKLRTNPFYGDKLETRPERGTSIYFNVLEALKKRRKIT
jgi:hypothetical protein